MSSLKSVFYIFIVQAILLILFNILIMGNLFYWNIDVSQAALYIVLISYSVFALKTQNNLFCKSSNFLGKFKTGEENLFQSITTIKASQLILAGLVGFLFIEGLVVLVHAFQGNLKEIYAFYEFAKHGNHKDIIVMYNRLAVAGIGVLLGILLYRAFRLAKLLVNIPHLIIMEDLLINTNTYDYVLKLNFKSALLILAFILLFSMHLIVLPHSQWLVTGFIVLNAIVMLLVVIIPTFILERFYIKRRKIVEIGLLNHAHSKLGNGLKTGVSKLGYTEEISRLNEEYEILKTFSKKLVGHGSTPWSKRPSFYINTVLAVISPVILQMGYTLVEKFLHGIIS